MKKKNLNFLLIVLIVITGFGSCTVKKRLYQPGYFVEWHKLAREKNTQQSKDASEIVSYDNSRDLNVDESQIIEEQSVQHDNSDGIEPVYVSTDEDLTNIEIVKDAHNKNSFNTETKTPISEKSLSAKKEKRFSGINGKSGKAFWPAKVGLILGILAWLAIVGIFLNTSSLALVILLSWLCVLLFVGGAIFSAVALVFTIIKPEKFKGKRLAIAALVVSLSIPFLYFLYQIVVMFITMFIVFA